jgi:predicted patatin/cPLA2 family phospholipase
VSEPGSAIVVEGGAMRGIYSAGVLDVFLERDFHPFALAVGASAGACNLSSHLAGQHGRNRRCYTTQMRRSEFVDPRRFLRGGHWLDLDYLWDAFAREDPLDVAAATGGATRLVVAATAVATGEPEFFTPGAEELIEVLRASSAVPILFRRVVTVKGKAYVDGGVSAPIPVEEAYRRGARALMVVRSRPREFGGPSPVESVIARVVLKEPGLRRAFAAYREVYARSVAWLRTPPAGCRVVEVVPAEHLRTGRTTRDVSALEHDYRLGRDAGEHAIRAWRASQP